jgi:2-C-methyl-D-erythritol 4-phosphate cytidylyltransferase
MALGHGLQDAQKTMGVIFLALLTGGYVGADDDLPLWASVIETAAGAGGALPADEHGHLATLDGSELVQERIVAVQTPQAFAAAPLLEAYRRADADGFVGTDTASCIERYTDVPVHCVAGDAGNIKITFPDDLFIAERLLAKARWDLSGGREARRHDRREGRGGRRR